MSNQPQPSRRETETLTLRKTERVPLGVHRQKLNSTARPGYEERWMNDDRNRIEDAINGGYTMRTWGTTGKVGQTDVTNRFGIGDAVSKVVGTKADGTPLMSYLMEIKSDFYAEDQAAKLAAIRNQEKAIFDGSNVAGTPGVYTSGLPQSMTT